jgi:hypothetical protein
MKAIIVNRNLLSTLKETLDFLSKESRIDVIVYDQQSTYPPLLEYYKTCPAEIVYAKTNGGPHSVWGNDLKHHLTDYFIITDSDCSYEGVPDDWLDVMLNIAKDNIKVGFSLDLNLPETPLRQNIIEWESKFWVDKNEHGWIADIDTTFALYPPNSPFTYRAIRLDKPYCIKHIPWYLTNENITEEWKYYLKNASHVSTWGSKLKQLL